MTTPLDISPEAVEELVGLQDGNNLALTIGTLRALRTALTAVQHAYDDLNVACGQWKEAFDAKDAALQQARTALTASEKRVEAANKLWRICVAEGFPWWDGTVQEKLTEIGLLTALDMTAEEAGPECSNCEGDCETCYRAIEKLEDLK